MNLRGNIFYIENRTSVGSEQSGSRPGIVVSNDIGNEHSMTVEVVYMTTKEKTPLPTHVTIQSGRQQSTALCEQITTVAKERLGDWMAKLSDDEMRAVEDAMLISLGITVDAPYIPDAATDDECDFAVIDSEPLIIDNTAAIERDIYRTLYNELLGQIVGKVVGKKKS